MKFDGHDETIHQFCFSPDGSALASTSESLYISFWDVKTGLQKAKISMDSTSVVSAFLLMVPYWLHLIMISTFIFGILRQDNYRPN